jgi:hypothetical protein
MSLSGDERRLLEAIWTVGVGRIEGLVVVGGQPIIDSMTLVRHVKLVQTQDQAKLAQTGDFLLKAEFVRLFEIIRWLESATIRRIEIRHGLPAIMELVKEPASIAELERTASLAGEEPECA